MKSVIKKQTHYNLLLMRDDAEARNYRVHGRTLRFFIWFFLLLVAGGAVGIYGGYHFWEKYRVLAERYDEQEREVSEMKLQLERLIALETVLSASNGTIPQARHAEVGADQAYIAARNDTSDQVSSDDTSAAHDAGAPPDSGMDNATTVALDATEQGAQLVADDAPAPDNGVQEQESSYPRISSPESPLRVTGLNVRVTGQQRLSIRHELVTEGNTEQRMISGNIRYYVVFADGTRVEPSVSNIGESRFSIARMKLVQNSLQLPQGYRAADVEQVDVLLELSDGERFEERFEMGA